MKTVKTSSMTMEVAATNLARIQTTIANIVPDFQSTLLKLVDIRDMSGRHPAWAQLHYSD